MNSPPARQTCPRHEDMPATTKCSECGKPICRLCVEQFGYFCSAECLEESRADISTEDREEFERENEELEQVTRRTARIGWIVGLVALAALAF